MSMHERSGRQEERESAPPDAGQDQAGDEAYGGDTDAEPGATEEQIEQTAERAPAEG